MAALIVANAWTAAWAGRLLAGLQGIQEAVSPWKSRRAQRFADRLSEIGGRRPGAEVDASGKAWSRHEARDIFT